MPVPDGTPTGPVPPSGCPRLWMIEHGLWSAADDAVVIERYGANALDSHEYCCGKSQPWRARADSGL